jgi:hypothetical protein
MTVATVPLMNVTADDGGWLDAEDRIVKRVGAYVSGRFCRVPRNPTLYLVAVGLRRAMRYKNVDPLRNVGINIL